MNIVQAIQSVTFEQQQTKRKEAQNLLDQYETQNPQFCWELLQLFQSSEQMKVPILLLLKNVIIRKWNLFIACENNKRIQFISKEIKNQLKAKLLELYQAQQGMIQKEIQLIIIVKQYQIIIIQTICQVDNYPHYFKELIDYFAINLINPNSAFIDLMMNVFKHQAKQQQSNIQLTKLWDNLYKLWQTSPISQQALDLNRKLDKLITYFIIGYHFEVVNEQVVCVLSGLMTRYLQLTQLQNVDTMKNRKNILKMLTNLQINFPLGFYQQISDYQTLITMTLNNNEQLKIQKGSTIALIRLLKTHEYFCTLEQYNISIHHKKDNIKQAFLQLKQNLENNVKQFFISRLANFIDNLFQFLCLPQKELDIEELIEQEEENNFEQLINPYLSPIYSLSLIALEMLITRFPQEGFACIQNYVNQMQQANYQINPVMMEAFLAIIGILPRISAKTKVDLPFSIFPLLQYLHSQQQNVQFQRRFVILSNRIVLKLDSTQMIEIFKTAVNLLATSQDQIVRYQALMCVKEVVNNYKEQLAWTYVLECVAPQLVKLLQNFTKPSVIQPLLELIQNLVQKCQCESQDALNVAIQKSGLMELMMVRMEQSNQNQLLIDGLCEMIKTLIVTFPMGTALPNIYQMAITLINNSISQQKASILSLLLFILQEYDPQNYDLNVVSNIYEQNKSQLLNDTDPNNIALTILIIEELVILNVIQDYAFYIQFMEMKYISKKIEVKNACLNLSSTMMLLLMNNNQQLSIFQNLIKLFLQDFLQVEYTEQLEHKFSIEIQLTSILNRFIIQDCESFVSFLNMFSITPDQYIQFWMKNQQIVHSPKAIRLNLFALGQFLPFFPLQTFLNYQTQIINSYQETLKKIQQIKKDIKPYTANFRMSSFRSSLRKDALRECQMYDSTDVGEFFRIRLRNYAQSNQLNNIQI